MEIIMRLNGWQLFSLGIPFIFGGIVYLFSDDIVKNIHYLFPEYQDQSGSIMINKKVDTYLEIEKKSGIYNEIEEKLASRRSDAIWITDSILYSKDEIIKEEAQELVWKLEMVYPKKNIAIINGKLAKINDIVDGARVVEIENLRVLLEHNERLEWVTLFQ
jgi:hypothetical protein